MKNKPKTLRYFYDNEVSFQTRKNILESYLLQFEASKASFNRILDKDIKDIPLHKVLFFVRYFSDGSLDKLLEKADVYTNWRSKGEITLKELLS